MFVCPPGNGQELRISYERESDCSNPIRLRSQASSDTNGLTRGWRITSPKVACAMYEAMCSLADNFERGEPAWSDVRVGSTAAARGGDDAGISPTRVAH